MGASALFINQPTMSVPRPMNAFNWVGTTSIESRLRHPDPTKREGCLNWPTAFWPIDAYVELREISSRGKLAGAVRALLAVTATDINMPR
jgi:hypothetical protein